MAEIYVDEFLWRGRPSTSDQPSGYHIVLASAEVIFGQLKVTLSDTMNAEQAAAAGFPLETTIATINAAMIADRDKALAVQASAESARDAALAAQQIAESERDAAIAAQQEAEQALAAMQH